jgi:hypothetical protein
MFSCRPSRLHQWAILEHAKRGAIDGRTITGKPSNLRKSSLVRQKDKEELQMSRFPLALSPKTKRTRSYTSCESTHVTSGVNTRQTPSNLTGIRTMEITAWQSDALSSRDRRGSGRRGLSRRSGRVDIGTYIRDADS